MKIEKLTENKIRITLDLEDLKEKNIDFHSFMANPIESQSLFLDMLDTAEKEIGFVTKDYKISIEALALSNGNFVLTVTRDFEENLSTPRRKVQVKRKSIDFTKTVAIYSFPSFEELFDFCKFIKTSPLHSFIDKIQTISLYQYQDCYFLCFKNVHGSLEDLKGFCSAATEFGTYVSNSDLFERKLVEHGTKIMKHNAIDMLLKYF